MRRYSAGAWAMARDRRMTQRLAYAKGQAEEAALRAAWASFTELAVELHTDEDTITDPRVRALLEKVDKELLEYRKQHVVGFLKIATEQAAPQISRDIIPAPPGLLLWINACGAGVEQSAPEARIHEMLLDFLGNPSKLRVPEISPPPVTLLRVPGILPATMPKEGVQPAPEPGEQRPQPEHIGIPLRDAETLFRRHDEQALSTQEVAELKQQLTEERREKVELKRQLVDVRGQLAERDRQLAEERQETQQARAQLAEVQAKLERWNQEAQAQRERRRAKNVEASRRYRERHGDTEKQRNTEYKREWRARPGRGQGS